jgi:hypothetical protein
MRPRSIQIENWRILPLLIHFHVSTVVHFSFLGLPAPSIRHDADGVAIRCLPDRCPHFDDAGACQSNVRKFFKLSLLASVKVYLIEIIKLNERITYLCLEKRNQTGVAGMMMQRLRENLRFFRSRKNIVNA